MKGKPMTIKDVDPEDREYLLNMSVSMDVNVSEALSHIITLAKNNVNSEKDEEIKKLKLEYEELDKKCLIAVNAANEANSELEIFKNTPPKTIEKEVEKIVPVPIQLTGSQFICEFTEETANAARKLRKFMREDKYVSPDGDYPNELANIAVKQFIKRNYSDIVNL